MSNAEREPNLIDATRSFVNRCLGEVHTAIPGRVESYDATLQRASIQPLIKEAFENEGGERIVSRLPVIPGVPVQWPQGGGYFISFPLEVGDTGLLLFSQASLDVWLSEGGEVDPLDDRRFALSDGIFIPGVRSFKAPLSDASGDHAVFGKSGGLQIHIGDTTINIGSDNGAQLEFAALGETVVSYLGSLALWVAAINTWALTVLPPYPNIVLPPIPGVPPTPPLTDFVSTSIRVKK